MKIQYDEDNIPDISKLTAQCYDDVELIKWTPEMEGKGAPNGIKKIGVLTSGGDAPGMNAAVRAVVRAGLTAGIEVFGIKRGYQGLLKGEIDKLESHDVSDKMRHGGTFLMTARSKTFATPEGTVKAAKIAGVYDLDAIVTIGGDGTFRGARALARIGIPVIGIPATIDNDVCCSDYTIGFDTALNTALDAVDKLRDTASSHERCSVIEVMGRSAGYLAYNVGLACGAERILIPEVEFDLEKDVIKSILTGRNYGKTHWIIVVAEGVGNSIELAREIEKVTGLEARASILGYVQRGGAPSIKDRTAASLMGLRAIDCILSGRLNRLVVEKNGEIVDIDIEKGLAETKTLSQKLLENANRLF